MLGEFVWTGIDYIGDSGPHDRNAFGRMCLLIVQSESGIRGINAVHRFCWRACNRERAPCSPAWRKPQPGGAVCLLFRFVRHLSRKARIRLARLGLGVSLLDLRRKCLQGRFHLRKQVLHKIRVFRCDIVAFVHVL